MNDPKFGIEAEYALVRPQGVLADFTNTHFSEVQRLLAPLPDYRHPELRVGDAGIRVKNWYMEGDERFDEAGQSTGFAFKGLEIRTPVCRTIEDAFTSLKNLRLELQDELAKHSWHLAAVGFNPCTAAYQPEYEPWEKELHASHMANALPEISTLSYGPDFNFSSGIESPQEAIETARRFTYYSPYIVPFSFSSPITGGTLWGGLSYRTYMRTGTRPAALAHLSGVYDHPLVKEADPPFQHLRIEFKAFDMVGDDQLLMELFRLLLGISLARDCDLPGKADRPDRELHRHVAICGFSDGAIHAEAHRVVGTAQEALRRHSHRADLPLVEGMLATRRTPAHAIREAFADAGAFLASASPGGGGPLGEGLGLGR